MRVLIDATSVLLRSAGIKNYTYHWIEHLKRLAGDEIQAFPFLNRFGDLTHEGSVLSQAAIEALSRSTANKRKTLLSLIQ